MLASLSSTAEESKPGPHAVRPPVSFKRDAGRLDIVIGGQTVATYVYEDTAIPRPFFQQVKTLHGIPITRPNPPDPEANKGNDDHPTFHPGIWLAFGDINGQDFWRNKARVRHVRFVEPFLEQPERGEFSVENEYVGEDGTIVCHETCVYRVQCDTPNAYSLSGKSDFRSDRADFAFGDQEEMGLGVRMNTPLTVKFGEGKIRNSEGGVNEKGTWGQQAQWCAAYGRVDGKEAGIVLMPAPDNFRPSWFHTRDYGLIVANPFGKKSMTGPKDASVLPDSTLVKQGDTFTFGWRVSVFEDARGASPDFNVLYPDSPKPTEDK